MVIKIPKFLRSNVLSKMSERLLEIKCHMSQTNIKEFIYLKKKMIPLRDFKLIYLSIWKTKDLH